MKFILLAVLRCPRPRQYFLPLDFNHPGSIPGPATFLLHQNGAYRKRIEFTTPNKKGIKLTSFQASVCLSVAHSLIISVWCGMILARDDWDFVEPSTPSQANMLAFSLAYFVLDAILCLMVLHDFEGSFHHITVMFAALFLVGRMIVAPYLATWLCDSPTTPIEVKVSCLVVKTFVKGEDEKPEDPGLSSSQESFSAAPKVYIKSRKAAEAERTIMILGGYSSSSSLSSSDSDSDEDLRPAEDTAIKETQVASPVPSRGLPSSSALEEAVSVDDNRGRIDGCERHSDTTIDDIRPAVNDGSTEPKADDDTPASALSAGRYAGASLSVSLGSPSSEPSTPEEVERVRDAPDAHTYCPRPHLEPQRSF
ncbi:hypothetical protein FOZ60_014609 [Perkinsus olseni]|uniref:Uncharacterized protein n=1 Tax=Perkinsus olseni TaxID=32597 RepID=A0A7J6PL41_PEROL|nr:hypothetical protein FOZ60_014609 [Perkinsus olseni]